MSIFKNFSGTMKAFFRFGGPSGNGINNEADGLAVRNSANDANANMHVAQATLEDHAVNFLDLRDTDVLMQFIIDGGTPPSAGDNTGTYGFCHTSGGAFSAGQVYYDDGTALRATKLRAGSKIATGSQIDGTVSLMANGIYVAHSSSAPYTWTLKGDGSAEGAGYFRVINIPIDTAASKSSTTSIPDGGMVYSVGVAVTTPYDSGTTIGVIVDGSSELTIQGTSDNDPEVAGVYLAEVEDGLVTASTEGVVTVNIAGGPAAGAGFVSVNFTTSTLA